MSRTFYEHTYVRKFFGRFKGTSEFDLKIGVCFRKLEFVLQNRSLKIGVSEEIGVSLERLCASSGTLGRPEGEEFGGFSLR